MTNKTLLTNLAETATELSAVLFECGFLAAILPRPYKEQEMLEQVQSHQPKKNTQKGKGSIEHLNKKITLN